MPGTGVHDPPESVFTMVGISVQDRPARAESEELVTERFGKVIDGLWKLVGSRLAWGLLQSISAGSRVSVGDVRLDKNGLWLTKRVWFKTEWYHAPWEELQYSSSDGALVIRSQKECKASARLSYRDTDNTHVLENLLEFLFKDGNFQRLHQGTLLD